MSLAWWSQKIDELTMNKGRAECGIDIWNRFAVAYQYEGLGIRSFYPVDSEIPEHEKMVIERNFSEIDKARFYDFVRACYNSYVLSTVPTPSPAPVPAPTPIIAPLPIPTGEVGRVLDVSVDKTTVLPTEMVTFVVTVMPVQDVEVRGYIGDKLVWLGSVYVKTLGINYLTIIPGRILESWGLSEGVIDFVFTAKETGDEARVSITVVKAPVPEVVPVPVSEAVVPPEVVEWKPERPMLVEVAERERVVEKPALMDYVERYWWVIPVVFFMYLALGKRARR